jgi:hypothetical protein
MSTAVNRFATLQRSLTFGPESAELRRTAKVPQRRKTKRAGEKVEYKR